jgi:hypothetical protein
MLIDEIEKKNINKKIKRNKKMRTTIEIKTKIRTTLNFGWASAIPEEMREITRGGIQVSPNYLESPYMRYHLTFWMTWWLTLFGCQEVLHTLLEEYNRLQRVGVCHIRTNNFYFKIIFYIF